MTKCAEKMIPWCRGEVNINPTAVLRIIAQQNFIQARALVVLFIVALHKSKRGCIRNLMLEGRIQSLIAPDYVTRMHEAHTPGFTIIDSLSLKCNVDPPKKLTE